MKVNREIEVKLEAPADVLLPDLAGLPGVTEVEPPDESTLVATYFDTADLLLAAVGITLRRRTGGLDAGWHLKVPVSEYARTEFQAPLGAADEAVPPDLVAQVRAVTSGADLAPVVRIRTTRGTRRLRDATGRALAVVCDDAVTARSGAGTDTVTDRWREWEVELVEGDRELLAAAATRLRAAGGVAPPWRSKLARALGDRLASTAAVPEPPGYGSAGVGLGARLRTQLAELRACEARARRDEPDGVHQMRVATRRLSGALATFRVLLAAEPSRTARSELRWLAGVLGAARDAEVSRRRLAELVAREPAVLRDGVAAARLDRDRAAACRAGQARVVAALDSERYAGLLATLTALVEAPSFTPVASEPSRRALAHGVRRDGDRLRRAFRAAQKVPTGPERDALLHEARKAAKRACYAAEAAIPAVGHPAEKFAREVRDLQDLLGHHHDSGELRAMLRRVSLEAHAAGEDTFAYGRLHASAEQDAERIEEELPAAWARVARARGRRWLR